MQRIAFLLFAIAAVAGLAVSTAPASGRAEGANQSSRLCLHSLRTLILGGGWPVSWFETPRPR
jgi:hypothetical protein